MSEQDLRDTLEQVRRAHRICAAFYQRVLPLISQAASELNLTYRDWNPRSFELPSKRSSPFDRWQWDYLPLINARFAFVTDTDEVGLDDYVLDIALLVDSALEKEVKHKRTMGQRGGVKGPDAVRLEEDVPVSKAETCLKVFVFVPMETLGPVDLIQVSRRETSGYPSIEDHTTTGEWGEKFYFGARKIPLEELMQNDGIKALVNHITVMLKAAREKQRSRI